MLSLSVVLRTWGSPYLAVVNGAESLLQVRAASQRLPQFEQSCTCPAAQLLHRILPCCDFPVKNYEIFSCSCYRFKTHKRLKECFLIRWNRTKCANFPGSPLFQARYNNTTDKMYSCIVNENSIRSGRNLHFKQHPLVAGFRISRPAALKPDWKTGKCHH